MTQLSLTGADLTLKMLAEFDASRPQAMLADNARLQMQMSVDTVRHVIETGREIGRAHV